MTRSNDNDCQYADCFMSSFMSKFTALIFLLLIVLNTSQLSAQSSKGVDLAAMQHWNIVVANDAIASEIYAAEEFQEFFRQASGVKLPIVNQITRRDEHVFIGLGMVMQASSVGFSVEDLGSEDLRIIVHDDNIAIAGGRPRGTLYGVYTFLEDYMGVRFLTYDHTHVPLVGDWRVVGPIDRFYHPPLAFRWSAYGETRKSTVVGPDDKGFGSTTHFAARLRCNIVTENAKLGGTTGITLANHSLYRYVPTKVYGKKYPEYFCMVNGKRLSQVTHDALHTELCLTNPDVLRIVSRAVLDELAANPQQRSVSISQSDSGLYCHCSQCSTINDREESPMGSLLMFVNAVADEVTKEYPNVKVGTLAYAYSQKPPKTIKAHPNVMIQLTSHDCSVTDPIRDSTYESSTYFRRDLLIWGRICRHINLWYYNVNFSTFLLPMPNLRVIGPNIRYFAANNIKGIFMQSAHAPGAELSDLRNYITSRLLWDPNQSSEVLINEFLDLHYGKAAPPIRHFINLVHDNAEDKGIQEKWWGQGEDYGIDESIIQAGLDAFEEAIRLADNEVVHARVEKASICVYYAAAEKGVQWAWRNIEGKTGAKMPAELLKTRPYFRQMLQLCAKHGVTHFNEKTTIERARQYFKQGYGIKPNEPW